VSIDSHSSEPLKAVVDVTPASCLEVVRALDSAEREFRRWSIVPPVGSWLQQSRSWLVQVAERGSLGTTDQELRLTSAAIAAAGDFYHISTCLGNESVRAIAVELEQITHGRLLAPSGVSAAKSYLSQFWVGALLAQSKLVPRILVYETPGRSRPDFVVTCEGVDFAVEVKRPRGLRSAARNVLSAGGQLRDCGRPSIIIIDATDCMSTDPWGVTRDGPSIRDTVALEASHLHRSFRDVVNGYSRSNKFSHVAMLMTYARYWPWILDVELRRDAGLHFFADGFAYIWSRQITDLTKTIQWRLLDGIEQLTGNRPSHRFV